MWEAWRSAFFHQPSGAWPTPRKLKIPPGFSGSHVDPLLKKKVFLMEHQVFLKLSGKRQVFGVGGMCIAFD